MYGLYPLKLASTRDGDLLDVVFVEYLAEPSIHPQSRIMERTQEPSWMDPIVTYLKTGEQPNDKTEAHILRLKAARYVLCDDKLYRKGYFMPLLKWSPPQKRNTSWGRSTKAHVRTMGGAVPSVQNPKARLLLANYEGRLHGVCTQMRQVLVVFTNIKSPLGGAHVHDQPMAIHSLGNWPNWLASKRER